MSNSISNISYSEDNVIEVQMNIDIQPPEHNMCHHDGKFTKFSFINNIQYTLGRNKYVPSEVQWESVQRGKTPQEYLKRLTTRGAPNMNQTPMRKKCKRSLTGARATLSLKETEIGCRPPHKAAAHSTKAKQTCRKKWETLAIDSKYRTELVKKKERAINYIEKKNQFFFLSTGKVQTCDPGCHWATENRRHC